jgi:uncharacterized SAM-binding protein YcdF (DUF218 family)
MSFDFVWSRRDADSQRGGIFFRLVFLLCFVAVLFLLYLVRVPLLRLAGNSWVVNEEPQPSDAIVILGDDNLGGERARRAAELFKAGWAPRLIASGRYLRPYLSVSELMQRDLTAMGVPSNAIIQFPHRAANTGEEAFALGKFLSAHGWKRIILVTSNYHTRRARYIYERALPAGMQLRVVAASDSDFDPDTWWRSYKGINLMAHETAGFLVAVWAMNHHGYEGDASGSANSDGLQQPIARLILCGKPADLHLVSAVL